MRQNPFFSHMPLLALLMLAACARPLSPTGGPRDEVPPEVSRTSPPSGTLRFKGKSATFYFSEPIRPLTYDKELFVSPFMERPRLLLSDNARRVTVRFSGELRPSTTYVLTLNDVKDNHESNSLREPFRLAFSTGDTLDSLRIQGRVRSGQGGQGEKDMLVLLFDADSIRAGQFTGKRPAYLTRSDAEGRFDFRYLRKAPYRILGVKDADQTNTYSSPLERIAIGADTLIYPGSDSLSIGVAELTAFTPDERAPLVQGYSWLGDRVLALRVTEGVDARGLEAWLRSGADSLPATAADWIQTKDRELLLAFGRPDSGSLHLRNLADSSGNRADTLLAIQPRKSRELRQPFFQPPQYDAERQGWAFMAWRPLDSADWQGWQLSDTARSAERRQRFPFHVEQAGFRGLIRPDTLLAGGSYLLRLSGSLLPDTASQDTSFVFPLPWVAPADLSTLAGKLRFDSTYRGPVLLQLLDDKKRVVRATRDTAFRFDRLPAGDYSMRVILDADSSGTWTNGSLRYRRLPERIFEDPEKISLRAGWEFQDQVVQIRPVSAAPAAGPPEPGGPGLPGGQKPPARLPGAAGKG
jgi:hypothetical protein